MVSAGFRYSTYSPPYNPGPEYWADVGQQMASRFPDATPQAIWIVGTVSGNGCYLNFPVDPAPSGQSIYWSMEDGNEEALAVFDELGMQAWLQVEPGNTPAEDLITSCWRDTDITPASSALGWTSSGTNRSTNRKVRL
jgi:hypothetical protein